MFGREICFYICTYWRNYRRKYWWPRCENKLSRRENNSMFNCCLHPGGRPSSIVAILLKSIIRAFIVLYSHLYLLFNNLLYLHVLKNKYLKNVGNYLIVYQRNMDCYEFIHADVLIFKNRTKLEKKFKWDSIHSRNIRKIDTVFSLLNLHDILFCKIFFCNILLKITLLLAYRYIFSNP